MLHRAARRCRGEDGVSLIIAMAFLSLLGVLVVSLLTVAYGSFKTTQVVRGSNSSLFGADGGVDYGIEYLRANSSICANAGSNQSLPALTVGGKTVAVSCQTSTGSAAGAALSPTPYSLIVTGFPKKPGASAWRLDQLFRKEGSSGSAGTVTIGGGPAFNAGNFYDKFGPGEPPTIQFQGDLTQWNSTTGQDFGPHCTNSKAVAASSGNPSVTGTWVCAVQASTPVPDPVPNLIVPTTTAPASILQGTCRIFFPGRYTSAPDLDENAHYYFASGVYYFDDVGEIKMEAASAFGGEPPAGESRAFSAITPCATDAIANSLRPGSATGKGVLFVMGKNSRWKIHNHVETRFEIFSRVPADPALEPPAGISIYAPRFDGPNWVANDASEVISMDGTGPQVVIHGLVYAPGSDTHQLRQLANPAAGGLAIFSGGLVVGRFEVKFDGSSTLGKLVRRGDGVAAATDRTVVVTATATGGGDAPISVQAVVRLNANSSVPPTVLSWRKT